MPVGGSDRSGVELLDQTSGRGRRVARARPAGRGWIAVLLVSAGLLPPACATSRGPLVIDTPDPSARAVEDGRWINSYAGLLASVRLALERELATPVPPLQVILHPDGKSFAAGLEAKGHDAAFARATARTMDGIGGPGWVLVNGRAIEPLGWPERTAMLAHELVHVMQYAWAGGRRGASEQWLREGFAEWVTMRVLIRLRLADEGRIRKIWDSLHRDLARLDRPRLVALRTFPEWLRWVESFQDARPYQFALLAVERLVQTHGLHALIAYFQHFATRSDRDAVFQAVFQQSIQEFDDELQLWLSRGASAR